MVKAAEKKPPKETRYGMRIGINDKVDVELFRDGDKYKDDVFAAVNGVGVQIKRGEKVQITKAYANVLRRQRAQDTKTAELMNSKADEFEEESRSRIM